MRVIGWVALLLLAIFCVAPMGTCEGEPFSASGASVEAGPSGSPDGNGHEDVKPEDVLKDAGFRAFEALLVESDGPRLNEVFEWALKGELNWRDQWLTGLGNRLGDALKAAFLEVLAALALPVMIGVILRIILNDSVAGAMGLLCRMACSVLLAQRYVEWGGLAADLLEAGEKLADAVVPLLASASSFGQAGALPGIMTPTAAICSSLIHRALVAFGLPVCGVAASVAMVANLSERFQINRLFRLLRRLVDALARLMTVAFAGIIALEGMLSDVQGSAATRVLQQAIRTAVPILGPQASSAAQALTGSAGAIRNAVGVTGMVATMGLFARPLLRLAASAVSLRLAGAVLEPVADPGTVRTIDHFGQLCGMLLALCAGCAMLILLLIGAGIGLAAMTSG